MEPVDRFLENLLPLLRAQRAKAAYLFGSWARGSAGYLPAIAACPVGVDLLVYTPEEFERLRRRSGRS